MKHDRANTRRLLGALGLTLALYLLFCVSGRLYTFTDNITVGVVTCGMAIADGRFQGQAALNHYQHPTAIPKKTKENQLVYVWG